MTYATLQWTTVDIVAAKLADGHGSILVRVHLDEGEAAIGLEAGLDDVTEVLEERDKVVLCGIWGEVPNVAGGLPLRGLSSNHVVTLDSMGGKVVVAEWGGWGHAHGGHGLLLGDRRLALLVGPVAADGTRTKPLSIHGAQSFFSIWTFTECNEAVATRATCLHIPHDTGL